MPCLIALLALLSPRLALFFVFLFSDMLDRAFDGWLLPLLGFFLLPWTTLAYTVMWDTGTRDRERLRVVHRGARVPRRPRLVRRRSQLSLRQRLSRRPACAATSASWASLLGRDARAPGGPGAARPGGGDPPADPLGQGQRRARCSRRSSRSRRPSWCARSPPTSTSRTWPSRCTAAGSWRPSARATAAGSRRRSTGSRPRASRTRRWRPRCSAWPCGRCSPRTRRRPRGAPCSTSCARSPSCSRAADRAGHAPGSRRPWTCCGRPTSCASRSPDVVDEARNAVWYLDGLHADAVPHVLEELADELRRLELELPPDARPLAFGSWIGGDRDGNPNVGPDSTRARARPPARPRRSATRSRRWTCCAATSPRRC